MPSTTTTILTAIATTFVTEGIKSSSEHIKTLIGQNKAKAIQVSLNEVQDLIRIVNDRVNTLENKTTIEGNLLTADAYHLIAKSIQSVSNFPNDTKTEIIGDFIVEKLLSNKENNRNHVITVCAEKLEYLSIKHLKILAGMYTLGFLKLYDSHFKELDLNGITPKKLSDRVSYLKNLDIKVSDFKFLADLGLLDIYYGRNGEFYHSFLFYPYADTPIDNEFRNAFIKTEVGKNLNKKELEQCWGTMVLNTFSGAIGKQASMIFEKVIT